MQCFNLFSPDVKPRVFFVFVVNMLIRNEWALTLKEQTVKLSFMRSVLSFQRAKWRNMTSIIKLTAVSGVQEESALCYLLQVDEFRFLLDCGWDENFSMDIIDAMKRLEWLPFFPFVLKSCYLTFLIYGLLALLNFLLLFVCSVIMLNIPSRYVHQVDAVLLSHPDPIHLGALPYAVGKLGLNCTIYATIPVYKMGQMFMYDLYQVLIVVSFEKWMHRYSYT